MLSIRRTTRPLLRSYASLSTRPLLRSYASLSTPPTPPPFPLNDIREKDLMDEWKSNDKLRTRRVVLEFQSSWTKKLKDEDFEKMRGNVEPTAAPAVEGGWNKRMTRQLFAHSDGASPSFRSQAWTGRFQILREMGVIKGYDALEKEIEEFRTSPSKALTAERIAVISQKNVGHLVGNSFGLIVDEAFLRDYDNVSELLDSRARWIVGNVYAKVGATTTAMAREFYTLKAKTPDDVETFNAMFVDNNIRLRIGEFMTERVRNTLVWDRNNKPLFRYAKIPMFSYSLLSLTDKLFRFERRGVFLNPEFSHLLRWLSKDDPILTDGDSLLNFHRPMLWVNKQMALWDTHTKVLIPVPIQLLRSKSPEQTQTYRDAEIPRVLRGLNDLGAVPWTINRDVLNSYEERMARGESFGDIPADSLSTLYKNLIANLDAKTKKHGKTFSQLESEVERDIKIAYPDLVDPLPEEDQVPGGAAAAAIPGKPVPADEDTKWKIFCTQYFNNIMVNALEIKNQVSFSKKWAAQESVKAANAVLAKDDPFFFLPYNMDFRGRAYPIATKLIPIGDDFNRALITFGNKVPLGPRGLYWLKVHTANLFGQDKMPMDERATWVDKNLHNIVRWQRDAGEYADSEVYDVESMGFWRKAKKRVQAFAACREVSHAFASGDPFTFASSLPIHQDGSCNGLQHYAAIARDPFGGPRVNLTEAPRPADVYSEIAEDVGISINRDTREFKSSNIDAGRLGSLFSLRERMKRKYVQTPPAFDPVTGIPISNRFDWTQHYFNKRVKFLEETGNKESLKKINSAYEVEKEMATSELMEKSKREARVDQLQVEEIREIANSRDPDNEVLKKASHDLHSGQLQDEMLIQMYSAIAVQKAVNRSLVKQTVMTSVYGVTRYGATKQIYARLDEARDKGQLPLVKNDHLLYVATRLSAMTKEATEFRFQNAFNVMSWLSTAAGTVLNYGFPVSWTSPLGLPVTQHYKNLSLASSFSDDPSLDDDFRDVHSVPTPRIRGRLFETRLDSQQMIELCMDDPSWKWSVRSSATDQESIFGKTNKKKQMSAFPPNYVHSIDSSHMMMTASRCTHEGVDFAAVHDSFWCHAANVDRMSRVLREEFVRLHRRDLLMELVLEWREKYPTLPIAPVVPRAGSLELDQILDSPYFFS